MADDFVQVAPDSTGKKIDNTTETTGIGTVERQRVSVAAAGSNNQLAIDANGNLGVSAGTIAANTITAGTVTISAGTMSNVTVVAMNAGTVTSSTITAALPAGTNVIGHVIADSLTAGTIGSATLVAGTVGASTITAALPAGTNVIGHVIVDSVTAGTVGSATVVAGTVGATTITAALPAGTNVIGHIIADSLTAGTVGATTITAGTVSAKLFDASANALTFTTKGVQATTVVPVQLTWDGGRAPWAGTADRTSGATAEAMMTTVWNINGTTTSATTYAVSANKTLRITFAGNAVRSGGSTATSGRARLRCVANGSTVTPTTASPSYITLECSSYAALAESTGTDEAGIPEGMEFAAGTKIGWSHIESLSGTGCTQSVNCVGFEY